ncbi:MAG: hypothetical protein QXS19_04825 [Candidatus Methanomethylicia archaeon]
MSMSVIRQYIRALQSAASADTLAELLMHLDFADSLSVPPSVIKRTRPLRERVMARWDFLEQREYAQYNAQLADDDEYPYY